MLISWWDLARCFLECASHNMLVTAWFLQPPPNPKTHTSLPTALIQKYTFHHCWLIQSYFRDKCNILYQYCFKPWKQIWLFILIFIFFRFNSIQIYFIHFYSTTTSQSPQRSRNLHWCFTICTNTSQHTQVLPICTITT